MMTRTGTEFRTLERMLERAGTEIERDRHQVLIPGGVNGKEKGRGKKHQSGGALPALCSRLPRLIRV